MPRYVITVTDKDAARLEKWLGGKLVIGQGFGGDTVPVAGLDAVSDAELRSVDARLRTGFAIYHAGGPGKSTGSD